jgi:flagellar hook-associated protein 3 FlgL
MTSSVSVGDLSRAALLRQANAQLKSRLVTLTQEASSGLRADVPAATNGEMGPIAHVQTRIALLAAHGRNAAAAQGELGGLQAAMEALEQTGRRTGTALQAAATLADDATLAIRSEEARADFHAAVRMLNVDFGGRYLLSGTAVDTPPLSDPGAILADAKARVAGLTTPAEMAAALDDWFSNGFADSHFHGNSAARQLAVSPRETVAQKVNALDPSFRELLKGLVLGALASDADLGLTRESKAALLSEAGRRVTAGTAAVTLRRADVGLVEAAVERAAARNASEVTAMSLARSEILAADPYETATALSQTEASLQNLYALTSRLSRLSLTDYL